MSELFSIIANLVWLTGSYRSITIILFLKIGGFFFPWWLGNSSGMLQARDIKVPKSWLSSHDLILVVSFWNRKLVKKNVEQIQLISTTANSVQDALLFASGFPAVLEFSLQIWPTAILLCSVSWSTDFQPLHFELVPGLGLYYCIIFFLPCCQKSIRLPWGRGEEKRLLNFSTHKGLLRNGTTCRKVPDHNCPHDVLGFGAGLLLLYCAQFVCCSGLNGC